MNKTPAAMVAALLAALLAGCASSPTPNWDLHFGEAVRQAREQQTLNPNAAGAPVVMGMDGKAAREAMTLYGKTFQSPPPVVNVINIGGPLGGGQ